MKACTSTTRKGSGAWKGPENWSSLETKGLQKEVRKFQIEMEGGVAHKDPEERTAAADRKESTTGKSCGGELR